MQLLDENGKTAPFYQLPEGVLTKVLEYLGNKPWAEVTSLLTEILDNATPVRPMERPDISMAPDSENSSNEEPVAE